MTPCSMSELAVPKKILLTTDTVGGVWSYSLNLAQELSERGVHVVLATLGPSPTEQQRRDARCIPMLELVEGNFALEWMEDPWEEVDAASTWLRELADDAGVDLVHLNQLALGAPRWHLPCVVVAHSCVFSWFAAVRKHKPDSTWQMYYSRVQAGLSSADAVTAPSRALLQELRGIYGKFPSVAAIHNGCDSKLWRPLTKHEHILCCGRAWDEAKNVQALDRAAEGLAWPVFCAGATASPGGEAVALENIETLGVLRPRQLADRFGHAPIFAAPAKYEPFGLSILEAAHCGCALVLGDIPSLRELWNDAALFVSPDDVEQLRRILSELITQPRLRRYYSTRACVRAQRYSAATMGEQYMLLYSRLLESPQQRLLQQQVVSARPVL